MSSDTISWRDILLSWLSPRSHDNVHAIEALLDKYIPDVIGFIRPVLANSTPSIKSESDSSVSLSDKVSHSQVEPQELMLSEVHLIKTCCQILEVSQCVHYIRPPPPPTIRVHTHTCKCTHYVHTYFSLSLFMQNFIRTFRQCACFHDNTVIMQSLLENVSTDGGTSSSPTNLELHVIYSIIWSFGGFLSHQNKITYDLWWRTTFNQSDPDLCFPEPGLIWDYYTKPGVQGFLAWRDSVPKYSVSNEVSSVSAFIPNIRAAAVQSLVDRLTSRGKSVLLTGSHGSGKTSLLQDLLNRRYNSKSSDTSLLHIYTNHLTTAKVVWEQVYECLEWDWGRRYTPKGCKKLVAFIDDLHNTEVRM